MDLPYYVPTNLPTRRRPAEYNRRRGQWEQGGRKRRGVKPYYHFVWPKDGRNGSKWGRTKDILQNKGPDMYVTISADKEDYMHHRPRNPEWSGHGHLDDQFSRHFHEAPWAKPFRRYTDKAYDFQKRNYRHRYNHRDMWTDAKWYPKADKRNDMWPQAVKDQWGDWWEDDHVAWFEDNFL